MNKRIQLGIITGVLGLIVIMINLVADNINATLDLTEEKRFSLTQSSRDVINYVEDPIYIKVLLAGEFPAGFERLEEATRNLLRQYRSLNSNIVYDFEDPNQGSIGEINDRYVKLKDQGIHGTRLKTNEDGKFSERLIFPYAIVNYGKYKKAINLLKAVDPGESKDVALNKSISLLEYKFSDVIYKLVNKDKPNVVLLTGRGELPDYKTAALETTVRSSYDIGRINIDSITQLSPEINLVIVPAPTETFSDRDKLILDQYVMNGGNVIWIYEKFDASVFAIDTSGNDYVPRVNDVNLDDLFFTYGVRFKSNLLLDLQCTKIPQVVAMQGGKPQTQMFPWFYHPVINGTDVHPITTNISNVNLTFPSQIETLEVDGVETTELLTTSPNSRFQVYPMQLTFDVLRLGEDPSKFNKGNLPLAILAQGEFKSHYSNRLTKDQHDVLNRIGQPFKEKSQGSKQLWVSDAHIMSNLFNVSESRISPVGYNEWNKRVYEGNLEFMLNAIDYMVGDINVMEARNKLVKLRLLNRSKVLDEKLKWQIINVVLPLVFLVIFGLFFSWWRKRKFAYQVKQ